MRFFLVTLTVFLVDQVSKYLALRYLVPVSEVKIFPFFYLTYRENTGMAFSLLSEKNSFLVILSLLIIVFLFLWIVKEKKRDFWLALLLGGALGNLFDRIFRSRVIDFLDFRIWPVFNLADASITISVLFLFWQIISQKRKR